ncbi:hypothetical protein J4217_03835 [Candidatus Pacearchaeota archaeon]|nr:hypothetical protein [uncultured archaeon]AQS33229.1 hypothetical protein [uncultured archaeon]MBS3091550.1 hypothetical protein [Candidatus Pacearchaeota archaeon]
MVSKLLKIVLLTAGIVVLTSNCGCRSIGARKPYYPFPFNSIEERGEKYLKGGGEGKQPYDALGGYEVQQK